MTPLSLGALLDAISESDEPLAYAAAGTLSGRRFSAESRALATRLRGQPEQNWALVADDTVAFARGFFALAAAGKTILIPQGSQREAIAVTGAEALLSDGCDASLPRLELKPCADAEPAGRSRFDPAAVTLGIHTSGSTARPKRVTKSLAQLDAEIAALEDQWGASLGTVPVAASVPHHHLYGLLARILWPLAAGRPIHAPTVGTLGASVAGTILVSSPAFLSRIAEPAALAARVPRAIFSSGAPLPEATAFAIAQAAGAAPIEIYGSTETGGIAWRSRRTADDSDAWQPLPGVEMRFADEGAGVCLAMRSPWTPPGEWLETGDLAIPLADGRFRLAGRSDGVIKLEDKRINLEELAAWLEGDEAVAAARVVVLAGERRRQIGAVIVPSETGERLLAAGGKTAFIARLEARLAGRYEPVLRPRRWRIVPALPVNAMGKLERTRLEALFADPTR